jgi:hypothetical protein
MNGDLDEVVGCMSVLFPRLSRPIRESNTVQAIQAQCSIGLKLRRSTDSFITENCADNAPRSLPCSAFTMEE